jgi:ADP-ribose pyrophosphatase YjhB (NUDIX family)
VERGETVRTALERELEEEAGVILTAEPELFAIYSNENTFPGDHVALFVARSWQQVRVPEPNREIAEHRLFPRHALPADLSPGAARRLREIFDDAAREPMW